MDVIISGYGKMGKEVEQLALKRGHKIVAILDTNTDWKEFMELPVKADVLIDFSMPETAIPNMENCFRIGLPIVSGTTGWHDRLPDIQQKCEDSNGSLFHAPNFSIGVNIFFELNRHLAKLMASMEGYSITLSETHHIHKLDEPSGTAVKIAEDLINENPKLESWKLNGPSEGTQLSVQSNREGEVTGYHELVYDSKVDTVKLSHNAKSRGGFVMGALLAAEFLAGKKGIYTMKDLLDLG